MATPKTTSGAEPLTTEEQAQLDALTARRDAAAAKAVEEDRKAQLASLQSVDKLVKLVMTDDIRGAIDTIIADPAVSFDDKQKVRNFSDSLTYNIGELQSRIGSLSV